MSIDGRGRSRFSEPGLSAAGFDGFVTSGQLGSSHLAGVPTGPGVYVVLRPLETVPNFTRTSVGGWFKDNDPTVPIGVLRAKWVPGAHLLYAGKATSGSSGTGGLRTRLRLLLRYGAGEPVGHQGGRYLWQVEGSDDYRYAWRPASDPTANENDLLTAFHIDYGAYPFANIAGPRR